MPVWPAKQIPSLYPEGTVETTIAELEQASQETTQLLKEITHIYDLISWLIHKEINILAHLPKNIKFVKRLDDDSIIVERFIFSHIAPELDSPTHYRIKGTSVIPYDVRSAG